MMAPQSLARRHGGLYHSAHGFSGDTLKRLAGP